MNAFWMWIVTASLTVWPWMASASLVDSPAEDPAGTEQQAGPEAGQQAGPEARPEAKQELPRLRWLGLAKSGVAVEREIHCETGTSGCEVSWRTSGSSGRPPVELATLELGGFGSCAARKCRLAHQEVTRIHHMDARLRQRLEIRSERSELRSRPKLGGRLGVALPCGGPQWELELQARPGGSSQQQLRLRARLSGARSGRAAGKEAILDLWREDSDLWEVEALHIDSLVVDPRWKTLWVGMRVRGVVAEQYFEYPMTASIELDGVLGGAWTLGALAPETGACSFADARAFWRSLARISATEPRWAELPPWGVRAALRAHPELCASLNDIKPESRDARSWPNESWPRESWRRWCGPRAGSGDASGVRKGGSEPAVGKPKLQRAAEEYESGESGEPGEPGEVVGC